MQIHTFIAEIEAVLPSKILVNKQFSKLLPTNFPVILLGAAVRLVLQAMKLPKEKTVNLICVFIGLTW